MFLQVVVALLLILAGTDAEDSGTNGSPPGEHEESETAQDNPTADKGREEGPARKDDRVKKRMRNRNISGRRDWKHDRDPGRSPDIYYPRFGVPDYTGSNWESERSETDDKDDRKRGKKLKNFGGGGWFFPQNREPEPEAYNREEIREQFWIDAANRDIQATFDRQELNRNVAKNLILFVGAGMNPTTITAARILKAQLAGSKNFEGGQGLTLDKFYNMGLTKVYSVDSQVPDDAATATALLCGIKTNNGVLGMRGDVKRSECSSNAQYILSTLSDAAKEGKAIGIVTSSSLVDATAAAMYAHTSDKDWKRRTNSTCGEIAQQLIENDQKITVALGGGRQYFRPNDHHDPEYDGWNSRENRDLIEDWLSGGPRRAVENRTYVWNKKQLDDALRYRTTRLLGLFEPDRMKFEVDRNQITDPSLAEMTDAALQMLRRKSSGYFLLVDGGRIAHAHERGNAYKALHEMLAFDDAVNKAIQMTSWSDTLIVVTSNYGTSMTMTGNPKRGNPILGNGSKRRLGGKSATTLLYADCPGYQEDPAYLQQSAVPRELGSPTGEDALVFARGPMAHMFQGFHEQTYIAHAMRWIACIGNTTENITGNCEWTRPTPPPLPIPPSVVEVNILGMSLNKEDTVAALYITFFMLPFIFVFLFMYTKHISKKCCKDQPEPENEMERLRLERAYASALFWL